MGSEWPNVPHKDNANRMSRLIQSTRDLSEFLQNNAGAVCVALDTEFVWERSFYPKLGIIQIGIPGRECGLVDVLSVKNLGGIRNLLEDASVTKVLHDALQDLVILRRATRATPHNIFDTRIAAGFAGLDCTISLSGLVETLLDVKLAKTETRTNWLRRPLSEEQTAYAVNDVRYLPDVCERLTERVKARGVEEWLREELAVFDERDLYAEKSVSALVQRVGIPRHFGRREIAVLYELVDWREREAKDRDRPRGHILQDAAAVELARCKPSTVAEVRDCEGVGPGKARRYGAEVLRIVRRCMTLPVRDLPDVERQARGGVRGRSRVKEIQALIRTRCRERQIDPKLVSSRADITRLLGDGERSPESHSLLRGWRRELLGDDLQGYLETTT